jgi:hypothetical protein
MATKPRTPKTGPARKVPFAAAAGKLADLRAAKEEYSKRLLTRPSMPASRVLTSAISPDPNLNLVGVGVGEKIVDGRRTGIMCVKLLVRAKYHEKHIREEHMLPKLIDGLPTDVEEVGLFRPLDDSSTDPRTAVRPAQPGCSVGCNDPSGGNAGTFGALVQDGNGVYILSNNHVLTVAGPGAPIYQPALLDDPGAGQIARLSNFAPLVPGLANKVDCAVAAFLNPGDASNAILQIGSPMGIGAAQFDMMVQKFGRTTGYRAGHISSVDTTLTVPFEHGSYTFSGQILISGLDGQLFADSGDSGALIVERNTNVAVGLLFARSGNYAVANHISDVLDALSVTLV